MYANPDQLNDSAHPRLICGVDIGGTKTEVCLIQYWNLSDYQILARERFTTDRKTPDLDYNYTLFIENLASLITSMLSKVGDSKNQAPSPGTLESIGLGIPGSVDPKSLKMIQGNLQFLRNKDVQRDLLAALTLKNITFNGKVYVENDANCFALAEAYLGAGAKWAKENNVATQDLCLIGVTLGTGVGGGLVVNGKVIRGRRGGAGEVGHTTLIDSGRACYCGKYGCAEQYLSGSALEHSYSSRASALTRLTGAEIFRRADGFDPLAIATIEYYRDHLVNFLSNLANFLDPHVIVLGGGLSLQERLYPGLSERLSSGCFLTENPPAVLKNNCGDSAGVLGAALLGLL